MFHYIQDMTASEASDAYRRAIRNLSFEQVALVESAPLETEGVSPLFRYARLLLQRLRKLETKTV